MKWLWWVSPLVFLFYLLIVSVWPTREQKRFRREVSRWLDELLGPLVTGKGKKAQLKSRRVRRLPPAFEPLVGEAGGGDRVTDVVLVPKEAYAAVRVASVLAGSNHVTVICRLADKPPAFVCRPLPEVDGKPVENRGVVFTKDALFMEHYLVEGAQGATTQAGAITKWLKKGLRQEILTRPDLWLRVRGNQIALTLYGHPGAEDIDQLVDIADAIYAEHGATGVSLFGDEAPLPAEPVKPPKPEPAPALLRIRAGAIDFGLFVLGVFFIALTLGVFAAFHPAVLFQSPDINPTEPWQGGWTTKGFGAFVAAEAFVVGLFVLQTYLAARHGATLGKLLLGVRVVRRDGARVGFWRVCLRSGALIVVPMIAAALTAVRPLSTTSFFTAMPTVFPAVALAAVIAAGVALVLSGAPMHDRVAGVDVVQAPPWRPDPVQLGLAEGTVDPIVTARAMQIVGAMVAFGIVVAIAQSVGIWPF